MAFDLYLTSFLVRAVAFLTCLALIFGARLKPLLVGLSAAAAAVLLAGVLWKMHSSLGLDYGIFWKVGRDVWAGQDPYAGERFVEHPFLNPPTALPLFALFAVLPLDVSFAVWTVLNALACLALVAGVQYALLAQDAMGAPGAPRAPAWKLSPTAVVGLTAALAVSDSSFLTFYLGQLSLLGAVLLTAALAAQARGKSITAGVCLAAATIKAATMAPFLLLFVRKADRWAWVSLGAAVLGLSLTTGHPAALPGDVAAFPERVRQLQGPGQVNDYSFAGTQHYNMLGFEHAFYRLGLRDRQAVCIAQYLALLALGVWVARNVVVAGRLPRAAACSLVALFSSVFLYHRNYDAVILAMPLVYCVGQARSAGGPARWLFAAAAVAVLTALYADIEFLRFVYESSQAWGAWGRIVQAVVLPCATWLILLAMALLVIGARTARAEAVSPPPRASGQQA
jgi:hypothetical protein